MNVKYLGGIGYILILLGVFASFAQFGGLISVVGAILAGIAWINLGRASDDKIMTINGILMILLPILAVVIVFTMLMSVIGFAGMGTGMGMGIKPDVTMGFAAGLLMLILGLLGILFVVFHVLSHLRAGETFGVSFFKYSAYCQIASFVLSIVSFALLFGTLMSQMHMLVMMQNPNPAYLLTVFGLPIAVLLIAGLVGLIAYVFTIIAFFSLDEYY